MTASLAFAGLPAFVGPFPVEGRPDPAPSGPLPRNRLLAALDGPDLDALRPDLRRVALKPRERLLGTNEPVAFVHFIEEGLASAIARPARPSPPPARSRWA